MYRVTASKSDSPISDYVSDWQLLTSAIHDADCLAELGFINIKIEKI
jgi:hypothetical protein